MKKIILFILIILIFICTVLYTTVGNDFLSKLDEKRVYKIDNIKTTEINTLNTFKFFENGIITYNNQKIVYKDFDNKILWENKNNDFISNVFVVDNYIFRQVNNSILITDKNNTEYIITEISGNTVNVSRENDKTAFIIKGSGQTLLIINKNNEVIVDKEFENVITGISVSDKSEAYSIITLTFENGIPVNTLYFNLADDVELWSTTIEKEILIKTKVINNNVIAIGTENIYYFNNNGKLMWKNSIYNKVLDYKISKENQRITILFDKGYSAELITYNFEGKVMSLQGIPSDVCEFTTYDNKIIAYNNNAIYLLHSSKVDKIFESTDNFEDILIEGNNIYILFKNKIIKGQIK